MIDRQMFNNYIRTLRDLNSKIDTLEDLGIDVTNFCNDIYILTDMVINSNFDELGIDTFFNWFYNYIENENIKTEDDVWNFLIKHYNHEQAEEVSCKY